MYQQPYYPQYQQPLQQYYMPPSYLQQQQQYFLAQHAQQQQLQSPKSQYAPQLQQQLQQQQQQNLHNQHADQLLNHTNVQAQNLDYNYPPSQNQMQPQYQQKSASSQTNPDLLSQQQGQYHYEDLQRKPTKQEILLQEKLRDLEMDLEDRDLEFQAQRNELKEHIKALISMTTRDHKLFTDVQTTRSQIQTKMDDYKQQHEKKVQDCLTMQLNLNRLECDKEILSAEYMHLKINSASDVLLKQQLAKKDQHIKLLELRVRDMEKNLHDAGYHN